MVKSADASHSPSPSGLQPVKKTKATMGTPRVIVSTSRTEMLSACVAQPRSTSSGLSESINTAVNLFSGFGFDHSESGTMGLWFGE
jgi:hypothetical protein